MRHAGRGQAHLPDLLVFKRSTVMSRLGINNETVVVDRDPDVYHVARNAVGVGLTERPYPRVAAQRGHPGLSFMIASRY